MVPHIEFLRGRLEAERAGFFCNFNYSDYDTATADSIHAGLVDSAKKGVSCKACVLEDQENLQRTTDKMKRRYAAAMGEGKGAIPPGGIYWGGWMLK